MKLCGELGVLFFASHLACLAQCIAKANTKEPSEALYGDASRENVVFLESWRQFRTSIEKLDYYVGGVQLTCAKLW